MRCRYFILALISLILVGCGNSEPPRRSFYHWKTRFAPSASEERRLEALNVGRIYIKYFDVDWPSEESSARPQAKVQFAQFPKQEVVPTVFITNRSIERTGEEGCSSLADRILKLIRQLHPQELPPFKEIQIDCDWTQGTRGAYFALLDRLRQQLAPQGVTLSATIRLHQIRYPKQTGVPPVDRGMLMFYNMGELANPEEDNSILDVAEGKRYIGNLDQYELPLDVALPIFAWGVLIREDRPIKLLNNLRQESIVGIPWLTPLPDHSARVDSNHYFAGHYLYAGDRIRFEEVSTTALMESARSVAAGLQTTAGSVSLYHLDSITLSHYDNETLGDVFDSFE